MDIDQAIDLVREDAEGGVSSWFPPVDGDSGGLDVLNGGRLGDTPMFAVQWVHRGTNNGRRDPLVSFARSDAEIEVHGVTIVEDRDGDEPLFRRYVDWVGVFDQLGLSLIGRVVVSERPGQIG